MSGKPTNFFAHIELNTQDTTAAKTFYSELFPDWKWEDMPGVHGPYTVIRPSAKPDGGMMQHPMPGAPSFWCPYVQVADIHAATAKAHALGAKSIRDNMDVGVGWISIFIDPTGAVLGLWQPKEQTPAA